MPDGGFFERIAGQFGDIVEDIGAAVGGVVGAAGAVTTAIDVVQGALGRDPGDQVVGVGRSLPEPPATQRKEVLEASTRMTGSARQGAAAGGTGQEVTFENRRLELGPPPRTSPGGTPIGPIQTAGFGLPSFEDISNFFTGGSAVPGAGMADAVELTSPGGLPAFVERAAGATDVGIFFRPTMSGFSARSTIEVRNPMTGRTHVWKNMGRPLLYSGDLAAVRRVRRVASKARSRVGGR